MGAFDIYFVGHRGAGKSTLATALAGLGWQVVDVDHEIEKFEGKTCAAIIKETEKRFRDLENAHVRALDNDSVNTPRIVVLGGGAQEIPEKGVCVWIRRDGWEETALSARTRLRPNLTPEKELQWMTDTREPRWELAADFIFDIPRCRSVERATKMLNGLLTWLDLGGAIGQRTYMVVPDDTLLERSRARVNRLGLAGIEIRSDLITTDISGSVQVASLRTDDPGWLDRMANAAMWDIEATRLDDVLAHGVLDRHDPRPLLLSSHAGSASAGFDELAVARARLTETHPEWGERVALKLAPHIKGMDDIHKLLLGRTELSSPHTLIPQGRRFAWLRPLLALRSNFTNYMTLGPAGWRIGKGESVPPCDLGDWLPYLGLPRGTRFDAVIGEPVHESQGSIWHRLAADKAGMKVGYVKVPVRANELETASKVFRLLGIWGISVTSPLKRHIPDFVDIDNVPALNTMRLIDQTWTVTDTDVEGMREALAEIEAKGITPGDIAVFGKGGVSDAVIRAIEESSWTIATHIGAREGWPESPVPVTLVVNAGGPNSNAAQGAPKCEAWLDLHYNHVEKLDVPVHVGGDAFFEGQAREQRVFWGYRPRPQMTRR